MKDFVTILTAVAARWGDPPPLATKVHTQDPYCARGWTSSEYDNGYLHRGCEVRVCSLEGLFELLQQMSGDPHSFIVRDRIKDGIDRECMRRVGTEGPDQTLVQDHEGHYGNCFDIDTLDAVEDLGLDPPPCYPPPPEYLDLVARTTRDRVLPEWAHGCDFIAQWSASAWLTPGNNAVKLHLWLWSSRPLFHASLQHWATAHNARGHLKVDPSLYHRAHVHYTAAPKLQDPRKHLLPDHLEGVRVRFIEGERRAFDPPEHLLGGTAWRAQQAAIAAAAREARLEAARTQGRRRGGRRVYSGRGRAGTREEQLERRARAYLAGIGRKLQSATNPDRHIYAMGMLREAAGLLGILSRGEIESVVLHPAAIYLASGSKSATVARGDARRLMDWEFDNHPGEVAELWHAEDAARLEGEREARQRTNRARTVATVALVAAAAEPAPDAHDPSALSLQPSACEQSEPFGYTVEDVHRRLPEEIDYLIERGGRLALAATAGGGKSFAACSRSVRYIKGEVAAAFQGKRQVTISAPNHELADQLVADLRTHAEAAGAPDIKIGKAPVRTEHTCYRFAEMKALAVVHPAGPLLGCRGCELYPGNLKGKEEGEDAFAPFELGSAPAREDTPSCPHWANRYRGELDISVQTHALLAQSMVDRHEAKSLANARVSFRWSSFAEAAEEKRPSRPWVRRTPAGNISIGAARHPEGSPPPPVVRLKGKEGPGTGAVSRSSEGAIIRWVRDAWGLKHAIDIWTEAERRVEEYPEDVLIIDEDILGTARQSVSLDAAALHKAAIAEDIEVEDAAAWLNLAKLLKKSEDNPLMRFDADAIEATCPAETLRVPGLLNEGAQRVALALKHDGQARMQILKAGVPWRGIEALRQTLEHGWGTAIIKGGQLHLTHITRLDLDHWRAVINTDATTTEDRTKAWMGEEARFVPMPIVLPDSVEITHVPADTGTSSRVLGMDGRPAGRRISNVWKATHLAHDGPKTLHIVLKKHLDPDAWTASFLASLKGTVIYHLGSATRGINAYQDYDTVVIDPLRVPKHAIDQDAFASCIAAGDDWKDEVVRARWRDEAEYRLVGAVIVQEFNRIRPALATDTTPKRIILVDPKDPDHWGIPVHTVVDPDELAFTTLGAISRRACQHIAGRVIEAAGGVVAPTLEPKGDHPLTACDLVGSGSGALRPVDLQDASDLNADQGHVSICDRLVKWAKRLRSWQLVVGPEVAVTHITTDRQGPPIPILHTIPLTPNRLAPWLSQAGAKSYRIGDGEWVEIPGVETPLREAVRKLDCPRGLTYNGALDTLTRAAGRSESTVKRWIARAALPGESLVETLCRLWWDAWCQRRREILAHVWRTASSPEERRLGLVGWRELCESHGEAYSAWMVHRWVEESCGVRAAPLPPPH